MFLCDTTIVVPKQTEILKAYGKLDNLNVERLFVCHFISFHKKILISQVTLKKISILEIP